MLTIWNTKLHHEEVRDFCEVFSGKGEITRALRAANLRGAAIDIDHNTRAFDLTSPSGFVLTLNEVLRCKPGSLLVLAPVCKSMSSMSRFTSGRSALNPWGHTNYEFVENGNTLACRTILLIVIAQWKGLRWILEQPDGSFFPQLPRFQWLLKVIQVFVCYFYMGKFNGATPKRHRLWSNDSWILTQITQKAGYMSRFEQDQCKVKTTRKYVDSKGVKRCVGIKEVLQNSQHYTREFGEFIAEQVQARAGVPLDQQVSTAAIPSELTDLELFRRFCMPLHETDRWDEAKMMEVLGYLGSCKHMNVPGKWENLLTELALR